MTLGLKDLYYAVCTEAEGAETYGAPKKMAEAMEADLSVKTETADLYADDALSESVKEFTNGTLKLGIKDLTPETLAEVLGQERLQKSSYKRVYRAGRDTQDTPTATTYERK